MEGEPFVLVTNYSRRARPGPGGGSRDGYKIIITIMPSIYKALIKTDGYKVPRKTIKTRNMQQ